MSSRSEEGGIKLAKELTELTESERVIQSELDGVVEREDILLHGVDLGFLVEGEGGDQSSRLKVRSTFPFSFLLFERTAAKRASSLITR